MNALLPTLALAAALWGAPALGAAPVPRVAVDIGHTQAAGGATSARGRAEFELNRDLAHDLVDALHARGAVVTLINDDGLIPSLAARPEAAGEVDLFVSIHHDSVSESELEPWTWNGEPQTYSDVWQGHSLFVSRDNPDLPRSLLCARSIGARLQHMGFVPTDKNARRRPWADQQLAVHYYDNLVVLYRTALPALLFEAGVIKNRDEELALTDPARRARMADGIATGIMACLSVAPREEGGERP